MPVTGLPVVLENSLCTLMEAGSLSSFKIMSNSHSGSSTIVIHFSAMPASTCELSPFPPRPKSQSKLKRDRERWLSHHNKASPCNTPQTKQSSPVSKQSNHSEPFYPSLVDSGVQCCDTPSVASSDQHTTSDSFKLSPTEDCVIAPGQSVVSTLHSNEQPNNTATSDTDCRLPVLTTRPPSDATPRQSLQPVTPSIQCRDKEEQNEKTGIFKSLSDLRRAQEYRQSLPSALKMKLNNRKRNRSCRRAVTCQSNSGEPTLWVQSDDLLFLFYQTTKTISSLYVVSENADDMDSETREVYEKFMKMNSYFRRDDVDVALTICRVRNFMRDYDPV